MILENDVERFSEIMFGLAENYPGTNLSMNGLMMRFEALKEFSFDDPITKHLMTTRWRYGTWAAYVAIDENNKMLLAVGGNPYDGAMEWRTIPEARIARK